MEIVWVLLAGFALDLLLGDPRWMPHPVVGIGKLITVCERFLRRIFPDTPEGKRAGGFFLTLTVVGVSTAVPAAAIYGVGLVDMRLKYGLEIFWCWQIFAARSLNRAADRVRAEVENGDISAARKYLSWIVGRDTAKLNFPQIIRAVCETVAENSSDGVIAPMFYMAIGGVPAGFFYKAGNTLDSMVGYKNDRYIDFGRATARFDDLLNFVPARITGFMMCPGAVLAGLDGKAAFRIFRRDRLRHASPNAGNPESACAGALGVRLLGDASYFGKKYRKDTVGDDLRPIEAEDITRSCRLMLTTSALCLGLMCGIRTLVFLFLF